MLLKTLKHRFCHDVAHFVSERWDTWLCSTLYLLVNFAFFFLLSVDFFLTNSFKITIRMSKSLDPDQDRQSVSPNLGPKSLQNFSAVAKSRHKQGKS